MTFFMRVATFLSGSKRLQRRQRRIAEPTQKFLPTPAPPQSTCCLPDDQNRLLVKQERQLQLPITNKINKCIIVSGFLKPKNAVLKKKFRFQFYPDAPLISRFLHTSLQLSPWSRFPLNIYLAITLTSFSHAMREKKKMPQLERKLFMSVCTIEKDFGR